MSLRIYKNLLEKLTKHDGLPNLQVYRMANIVDNYIAKWAGIENSIGDYIISIDKENLDENLIKNIINNIDNLNEIILFKDRNKKKIYLICNRWRYFARYWWFYFINIISWYKMEIYSYNFIISRRQLYWIKDFDKFQRI